MPRSRSSHPRPLLQRGRARRLRRAPPRPRRRLQPRSALDRRRCRRSRSGSARSRSSSLTLRLAEALTVRSVSLRPGPPAAPARRRAEQRDRQLSDLAAPQRRDHAAARLQRPAGAAADRSRRHRRSTRRGTSSRRTSTSRSSRTTSTATGATGIRRAPSPTTRPAVFASPCRPNSTSSRAAPRPGRRRRHPPRPAGTARAQAVRVRGRPAGALPGVRDQPLQPGSRRRDDRRSRRPGPERRPPPADPDRRQANPRQISRGRALADRAAVHPRVLRTA